MRKTKCFLGFVVVVHSLATIGCGVSDAESSKGRRGSGGSSANAGGTNGGPPSIVIDLTKCGDRVLDPGEQCDNGTDTPGCSAICQLADGWTCPADGSPCMLSSNCGDGSLGGLEACDDSNMVAGDGCAADCSGVESGYQCRVPGRKCVPLCGDGMIVGSESCDDMGAMAGDGCSSICLVEPGATCSGTPSVCSLAVCGNGIMEQGESCDAGELNGLFYGDTTGCSKTCTAEPVCRTGATTHACEISCGNGNIEEGEACDDGNQVDADGCSSACQIEMGFTCMAETRPDTVPCTQPGNSGDCLQLPVILRDFKSERETGGHPDFFYHGATISPPISVNNQGYPNTTHGNTVSFSKRYCIVNSSGPAKQNDATGRCWDIAEADLDASGKPAFNAAAANVQNGTRMCPCQFTDWSTNDNDSHVPGYGQNSIPLAGLAYVPGQNEHPVYRGYAPIVRSADSFAQWWTDNATNGNSHSVRTLELAAAPAPLTGFQFSSDPHTIYGGFFPLDPPANMFPLGGQSMAGPGQVLTVPAPWNEPLLCNIWPYWFSTAQFGAGNDCVGDQYLLPPSVDGMTNPTGDWLEQMQGWFHDNWFTTEARYLFVFNGPFSLQFYGDDDLFMYVNGRLVIDLGGVHQRLPGRVDIGADGNAAIVEGGSIDPATGLVLDCPSTEPYTMQVSNAACAQGTGTTCDCRARNVALGLEMGRTYEVAVFGADRGATESNFQLTLSGFATNRSSCAPRCGDGAVTGSEECDCGDGTQASQPSDCGGAINADAQYGGCTTQCTVGPYCGDAVLTAPEQCDMGVQANTASPYGAPGGCTPGCQSPHYCGDGVRDPSESCDLGANNGLPGQPCSASCVIVPV